MATLWDPKPSLRALLNNSLAEAAGALKQGGARFLAPSFPGMTGADDCRLIECPAFPERHAEDGQSATIERWPEHGMLTTRWPVVIYVLDGECDVRFGVRSEVRRQVPELASGVGQYVVTARRRQFLLIPSYFPRPDGGSSHWERPDVHNARSTLMWMIFFPTGCFLHFCKTDGVEHAQTRSAYLPVPRVFNLIEDLEGEVLGRALQWQTAARHYMELILLLAGRHTGSAQMELGIRTTLLESGGGTSPTRPTPHIALQHACRYIEDRLQEPLRTGQIAAAVGISTARLNELFRKYLQTTLSQYIIKRRIERASTLLRETNMAITLVATQSGFAHHEHFSRTFSRVTGLSPLVYRRRNQNQD